MSASSPLTSARMHGVPSRGMDLVTRSRLPTGFYGRMFRRLPPFEPADNLLIGLAYTMTDTGGIPEPRGLFAGYTYLGQFIDHDLTFDPVSNLQRDNDPSALVNFRTPRFDLDSLYGSGPDDQPYLYNKDRASFLVAQGQPAAGEDDLPRNSHGRAIIGDPRNDENAIVSQLHLAFLKYHNAVVKELWNQVAPAEVFERARTIVRWHYQWIVLKEFLPLVAGSEHVEDVLTLRPFEPVWNQPVPAGGTWRLRLRFFEWDNEPFMPLEFSGAAFRFGHSMVRSQYVLNEETASPGIPLFDPRRPDDPEALDLKGFRRRPNRMRIQWRNFFPFQTPPAAPILRARPIDTFLERPLSLLPEQLVDDKDAIRRSLPVRNRLRGKALGLPSGQAVARAMGIPESAILGAGTPAPITSRGIANGNAADLGGTRVSLGDVQAAFREQMPLWYYILKEAEIVHGGARLGPVGGRIVAETMAGLLHADRFSFLNMEPLWEPQAGRHGCRQAGNFGIADLLAHADRPDGS